MGYAIVLKDKTFGINRVDQVTPASNSSFKKDLTSISFNYGALNSSDNTISLSSITLNPANATQSYVFSNNATDSTVNVDPITGKVTLLNGFAGGNITIKATYGSKSSTATISNLPAISDEGGGGEEGDTYENLSISSFSYSATAASSTTSGTPSISYSYQKNGQTVNNGNEATVSYEKTGGYSSATVGSDGKVNFGSKNSDLSARTANVKVTVTIGGLSANKPTTATHTANAISSITGVSYKSTSSKVVGYLVKLSDFDYTMNWTAGVSPSSEPSPTITPVSPTTSTTLSAGDNIYKLTYDGKSSSSVTINVAKEITSISNATYSGSTEELTMFSDENPVSIKVNYNDGTNETISVSSVTPNFILPGTKSYLVSYLGKSTTLSNITSTNMTSSFKIVPITSYSDISSYITTSSTTVSPTSNTLSGTGCHFTYVEEGIEAHNDNYWYKNSDSNSPYRHFSIEGTEKKYLWATLDKEFQIFTSSLTNLLSEFTNSSSGNKKYGVYNYTYYDKGMPREGVIVAYNPVNEVKSMLIANRSCTVSSESFTYKEITSFN